MEKKRKQRTAADDLNSSIIMLYELATHDLIPLSLGITMLT